MGLAVRVRTLTLIEPCDLQRKKGKAFTQMQRTTALFWLGSSSGVNWAISDLDSPKVTTQVSNQDTTRKAHELHSRMANASNTELISRVIQLCDEAMQYFEQQENAEALQFIDLFTISLLRIIMESARTEE